MSYRRGYLGLPPGLQNLKPEQRSPRLRISLQNQHLQYARVQTDLGGVLSNPKARKEPNVLRLGSMSMKLTDSTWMRHG